MNNTLELSISDICTKMEDFSSQTATTIDESYNSYQSFGCALVKPMQDNSSASVGSTSDQRRRRSSRQQQPQQSAFQDSRCSIDSSAARAGSPILEEDEEGDDDQAVRLVIQSDQANSHSDCRASRRSSDTSKRSNNSAGSSTNPKRSSSKYADALGALAERAASSDLLDDSSASNANRLFKMPDTSDREEPNNESEKPQRGRRTRASQRMERDRARSKSRIRARSKSRTRDHTRRRRSVSRKRRSHRRRDSEIDNEPAAVEETHVVVDEWEAPDIDVQLPEEPKKPKGIPRRCKSDDINRSATSRCTNKTSSSRNNTGARPRRTKSHDINQQSMSIYYNQAAFDIDDEHEDGRGGKHDANHESLRSCLMEDIVKSARIKQEAKEIKSNVMDTILGMLLEDIVEQRANDHDEKKTSSRRRKEHTERSKLRGSKATRRQPTFREERDNVSHSSSNANKKSDTGTDRRQDNRRRRSTRKQRD